MRFHFDAAAAAQKLDLKAALRAAPRGTHIYVCGPSGFIDRVTGTARALGWPAHTVHQEYFGAAPVDTSADAPFEVRIASSGKTCVVPAD
nr:hypothetical protein [Massilia sp. JS1662]